MKASRFSALVDGIYRAGEDASQWDSVLIELARELGASCMGLHMQQTCPHQHSLVQATFGLDESGRTEYDWTPIGAHFLVS